MTHTFRFLPSSSFDTMADSPSLWLPSSPEPEEDAAPSSRSGSVVSLPSCSDDGEVILPDTSEECCQMGCLSNIQADRNLTNRYDELAAGLNDTTMADQDKLGKLNHRMAAVEGVGHRAMLSRCYEAYFATKPSKDG